MGLSLDVPTLFITLAVVCLGLCLAAEFLRRSDGHTTGLGWMEGGMASLLLGLLLIAGRPALYSILLGNPIVALGLALLLRGFRSFYGRDPYDPLAAPVVLALPLGIAWFALAMPSLRVRIVLATAAFALLLLKAAWVALVFGRRKDGALGTLTGLCLGGVGAILLARALHAAVSGQPERLPTDALTRAGLPFALLAGIGCVVGVAGGVNRRLLREARRARRAMEQLVTITAHELRAPVISILSGLEVLSAREGPADPVLPVALRNAERLRYLVDDLLELEKLAAGAVQLEPASLPPASLVEDAVELNRPYAERFGNKLEAEVVPGLPPVRADAVRVGQVLTNLITNAVKHSPVGGAVRVSCRAGTPGVVRFEVTDHGTGIPEELRDRIYDRFVSRTQPSKDVTSSGLGLAIARSIVEAHGGRFGFTTSEHGTTFYVELQAAS
jgi:signal transduction histidine kinase